MKIRSLLCAVSLPCAFVLGCASQTPAPAAPTSAATPAPASDNHVEGAKAKELVKNGAKLVDVRSPGEFTEKHIEGAVNVPVDGIGTADLGAKDAPIVVYCGSGKRAAQAASTLREKGYTKVYELGGMSNWDK